MVAVSDTSVISNLSLTGRLELLHSQFGEVWIPEAVRAELDQHPDGDARDAILTALRTGWLRLRDVENRRLAAALSNDLDGGEAEAIALATEIPADLVLIDEREGRTFARRAGLPVRGVLGILLRAKELGEVTSMRAEIRALRERAGFFVTAALEAEILRIAGE